MSHAAMVAFVLLAASGPAAAEGYKPPRASDGRPSLEGVWTNRSLTTLERRPIFKTLAIPEADARAFEAGADGRPPLTDDVGQKDTEWWETGASLARIGGEARSSWIVDPSDGRLPYTERGATQLAAAQKADLESFDGPEARPAAERCLIGGAGVSGAPLLNAPYNSNYQIVQTPEHVVIVTEMIRAARVVPLRPVAPLPSAMRPWTGDPVGRWDGDTLVVETRGFNPGLSWRAPGRVYLSPEARVTERFTRVAVDEIRYDFTVEDPAMFSRPWRAEMVLRPASGPMHEYACHEGNYSLSGVLAGGREKEREAAQATP
jgi:hypothetical protein